MYNKQIKVVYIQNNLFTLRKLYLMILTVLPNLLYYMSFVIFDCFPCFVSDFLYHERVNCFPVTE